MQERFGAGQVKKFAGFSPNPAKRRKVLVSQWRPTDRPADPCPFTVKPSLDLPLRLKTAQTFAFQDSVQHIYLDLLFSNRKYELVRFVNGPFCSRSSRKLARARTMLENSTLCKNIVWLHCDQPFHESSRKNAISMEQAKDIENGKATTFPALEQALAIEPGPNQVSALPFTKFCHTRNFIRRQLVENLEITLDDLGWQDTGRDSERFATIFQQEQFSMQVQQRGICLMCQERPIALFYRCMHQVSCKGCGRWKICPVCQ